MTQSSMDPPQFERALTSGGKAFVEVFSTPSIAGSSLRCLLNVPARKEVPVIGGLPG